MRIVWNSFHGRFSDSPRALYDALRERPDLEHVWLADPAHAAGVPVVRRHGRRRRTRGARGARGGRPGRRQLPHRARLGEEAGCDVPPDLARHAAQAGPPRRALGPARAAGRARRRHREVGPACSRPTPRARRGCAGPSGTTGRCWRAGCRATTCWSASAATRCAPGCAPTSGSPPTARPCSTPRPGATPRATTRRQEVPLLLDVDGLRRRARRGPRAARCARTTSSPAGWARRARPWRARRRPSTPTSPSCTPPPTCWSPTTPRRCSTSPSPAGR